MPAGRGSAATPNRRTGELATLRAMDVLGDLAIGLDDVQELLSASLPGMSATEADAFSLGFWAGAMAHAFALTTGRRPEEVAAHVDMELRRIEWE